MSRVISFHYKLTSTAGEVLDSSEGKQPLTFMEGAQQIIPGLEKVIIKLKSGEKKKVYVEAVEAYGQRREELLIKVPKNQLPIQEIKVGDRFRGGQDNHSPVFTVVEILDGDVLLDGNHPLAGEDLTFDVEVTQVREATKEEMEHGHAHGEGGHSH